LDGEDAELRIWNVHGDNEFKDLMQRGTHTILKKDWWYFGHCSQDESRAHLAGYISAKTEMLPNDRSRCVPASFASWAIHFHVLGIVALKDSNVWARVHIALRLPTNYQNM
jgi:hypothetical protein